MLSALHTHRGAGVPGLWSPAGGRLPCAWGTRLRAPPSPGLHLSLCKLCSPSSELRILLLCGSDLLESFCIPGLWNEADVSSEVPTPNTAGMGGGSAGLCPLVFPLPTALLSPLEPRVSALPPVSSQEDNPFMSLGKKILAYPAQLYLPLDFHTHSSSGSLL